MIADPLPRRLLILACSATKRHEPDPIPAIDRYDGPLWRTLRATDPCGRLARVGFLSARYGFRRAETRIEDYDAKLTRDLAERMIAGGMTTRWPRPPGKRDADNYGETPQAEIWSLAQHAIRPERGVFDEVCLAGGELYIQVMHSMIEGFKETGRVASGARVTVINGPIGRMRQELRLWLLAGGQGPGNET
jgi:hypothetical protein